jgi:hypothetical protein
MNKFVAGRNEVLRSVGFFTLADSAIYSITVYDTFNGTTPSSILSMTNGSFQFAGYHTVTLPSAISLTAGNDFFVRLTITNGGAYPYSIDTAIPGYSSAASASAGQSYYLSGGTWRDLQTYDTTANFGIKAYTTRVSTTGVDLIGSPLAITNPNLVESSPNLDFGVTNIGNTASGSFTVRFFLSDDNVIDPATDLPLEIATTDPAYNASAPFSFRMNGIAGTQTAYGTVRLAGLPDPFVTDAQYYIGMVIDTDNEVAENMSGAETLLQTLRVTISVHMSKTDHSNFHTFSPNLFNLRVPRVSSVNLRVISCFFINNSLR